MSNDEARKRNDAARRTLASLLSQDKTINAKIKSAENDVEKAQKVLKKYREIKAEINAKLQLLCDATSLLSTPQSEPQETTTPEAEKPAQYGSYTA